MSRDGKNMDWQEVMQVWATNQPMSVRELARWFEVPEATMRNRMETSAQAGLPWPTDWLMHSIDVMKHRLEMLDGELEAIRAAIIAEREVRRELSKAAEESAPRPIPPKHSMKYAPRQRQ